jgi:hypothetical protein
MRLPQAAVRTSRMVSEIDQFAEGDSPLRMKVLEEHAAVHAAWPLRLFLCSESADGRPCGEDHVPAGQKGSARPRKKLADSKHRLSSGIFAFIGLTPRRKATYRAIGAVRTRPLGRYLPIRRLHLAVAALQPSLRFVQVAENRVVAVRQGNPWYLEPIWNCVGVRTTIAEIHPCPSATGQRPLCTADWRSGSRKEAWRRAGPTATS